MLAAYAYRAYKSKADDDGALRGADALRPPRRERGGGVRRRPVAEAVNAARDLQNAPANALTPTALAERAAGARGRAASRCSTAPASRRPGWARSPPWRRGSDESSRG